MDDTVKSALTLYTEYISSLNEVLEIYLFGSYAYGEPNISSDIDLMVIIDDKHDVFKTAFRIQRALADRIVPLDVLVNNKSAFYKAAKEVSLQAHVKNEGVLLYGKQ